MVLEFCEDPWGPYRGKYPDPTDWEYTIICHYLIPFGFEKENYAEYYPDMDPDFRTLLLQHLHQIRESKGYDVERYIPGLSTFDPMAASENEYDKRRVTEAATVAIDKINAVTVIEWGKRYELVSRDKTVWARANRTILLTLKVKELDADNDVVMVDADADADAAPVEVLKTILAMVYAPHNKLRLKEWKYKL